MLRHVFILYFGVIRPNYYRLSEELSLPINEDMIRSCKQYRVRILRTFIVLLIIISIACIHFSSRDGWFIKAMMLALALSTNICKIPLENRGAFSSQFIPTMIEETMFTVSQVVTGIFLTIILVS